MTTTTPRAVLEGAAPAPDGASGAGAPATPATRAALRYYGGKARLAPWIMAHLPPKGST